MHYALMDTPVGPLTLASTPAGLAAVNFGAMIPPGGKIDQALNRVSMQQLDEYFCGRRRHFDLSLDFTGTEFQMDVWRALLRIPYGKTRTYGEIAREIGRPAATRAVGLANHENPIAIVIPCHRVIGRDGSLTGYGGGLHIKRHLLSIEQGQALFS